MPATVAQGSNLMIGSRRPCYTRYCQDKMVRIVNTGINHCSADDPIESTAGHSFNNEFLGKVLRGLIECNGERLFESTELSDLKDLENPTIDVQKPQ